MTKGPTKVHLIGICGSAMATLAAMLKQRGFDVHGSDQHSYPPMSEFLGRQGIMPLPGYNAAHIHSELDLVVIGNAVSRGNPEVEAVLEQRIPYRSLPEMVREQFLWRARALVVAGTHGKTTTASMLAWVLVEGGLDPSFMIGGIPRNFEAGYRLGGGEAFVIEGDEYDSAFFDKSAKFLKYLPAVAVVNSIEFDHADIYQDLEELRVAFRRFIRLVPPNGKVLVGADETEAAALAELAMCPVETFGLDDRADWRATAIRQGREQTAFELIHRGTSAARVTLPLLGTFNVRNALATFAAAAAYGLPPSVTADALARFQGVRRRLEIRGVVAGVTVYDDFAHHPSAVRETLSAVRAALTEGRLWAVFEPRSATACRRTFQERFAGALQLADQVVVGAVFRTLPADERLSEAQLVADLRAAGTAARHEADLDRLVALVADEARSGDQVVIMSNGDFGGIHERLLERLASGAPG